MPPVFTSPFVAIADIEIDVIITTTKDNKTINVPNKIPA